MEWLKCCQSLHKHAAERTHTGFCRKNANYLKQILHELKSQNGDILEAVVHFTFLMWLPENLKIRCGLHYISIRWQ